MAQWINNFNTLPYSLASCSEQASLYVLCICSLYSKPQRMEVFIYFPRLQRVPGLISSLIRHRMTEVIFFISWGCVVEFCLSVAKCLNRCSTRYTVAVWLIFNTCWIKILSAQKLLGFVKQKHLLNRICITVGGKISIDWQNKAIFSESSWNVFVNLNMNSPGWQSIWQGCV